MMINDTASTSTSTPALLSIPAPASISSASSSSSSSTKTSTSTSTPRSQPAISPFSDSSSSAPLSDATSDEQPDLGAFTTVLRAWTYLQPQPRIPVFPSSGSSRTYTSTSSTSDSQHSQSHPTIHLQPQVQSHSQPPQVQSHSQPQFPSHPHPPPTIDEFDTQTQSDSYDFDRRTATATASELLDDFGEHTSTVWNHLDNYIDDFDEHSLRPAHETTQTHLPIPGLEDGGFQYTSPPPSPASTDGALTIEIASELEGDPEDLAVEITHIRPDSREEESIRSVSVPLKDGALNSIDGSVEDRSDPFADSTAREEPDTPREVSVMSTTRRIGSDYDYESTARRPLSSSSITSRGGPLHRPYYGPPTREATLTTRDFASYTRIAPPHLAPSPSSQASDDEVSSSGSSSSVHPFVESSSGASVRCSDISNSIVPSHGINSAPIPRPSYSNNTNNGRTNPSLRLSQDSDATIGYRQGGEAVSNYEQDAMIPHEPPVVDAQDHEPLMQFWKREMEAHGRRVEKVGEQDREFDRLREVERERGRMYDARQRESSERYHEREQEEHITPSPMSIPSFDPRPDPVPDIDPSPASSIQERSANSPSSTQHPQPPVPAFLNLPHQLQTHQQYVWPHHAIPPHEHQSQLHARHSSQQSYSSIQSDDESTSAETHLSLSSLQLTDFQPTTFDLGRSNTNMKSVGQDKHQRAEHPLRTAYTHTHTSTQSQDQGTSYLGYRQPDGHFQQLDRSAQHRATPPVLHTLPSNEEDEPSLGYLDEALNFLAEEKAKFEQREAVGSLAGVDDWRHVIEPRRKRRRKRNTQGTKSAPPERTDGLASDSHATGERAAYEELNIQSSPSKTKRKASAKAAESNPISILKRRDPLTYAYDGSKTPTPSGLQHGIDSYSLSSSSDHQDGDLDDDDLEADEEEEYSFSSSSNQLQKGKGTKAYIHGVLGKGIYKSTPPTPGTRTPKAIREELNGDGGEGRLDGGGVDGSKAESKKKKKTRTKRRALTHSKSVPQLRADTEEKVAEGGDKIDIANAVEVNAVVAAEGGGGAGTLPGKKSKSKKEREKEKKVAETEEQPKTKRERLIALAKKLQEQFPAERRELEGVMGRLQRQVLVKRHPTGKLVTSDGDDEEDEEEVDPRGCPPKDGDTLVHVFIDHSNILIGLLNHLRRLPPAKTSASSSRPLPPIPTSLSTATSAFDAVNARPKRPAPVPIPNASSTHPIPLPSFATGNANSMSRSLPSGSVLSMAMGAREKDKDQDNNYINKDANSDGELAQKRQEKTREKKRTRHLWHAALALILERGRSVTRRVVVTSSPLFQPMDGIERLGYEVRVYLRVPDLGDGMDRERYRDRDRDRDSQPGSYKGSKNPQTPAKNTPGKGGRHVRGVSGSDSGSGGNLKSAPAGISINTNADLHPYYMATNLNNNINSANSNSASGSTSTTAPAKIKYREQGVDELLQLKLHQAIAATDNVPEGATIVLATGDGNVGQFNEDGFLGPVRTALRKGWKVELYAWEEGLSRSWRREFGKDSEWERTGMFRIIAMEQFASGLVESTWW
ncbi:hypothetical protein BDQ12DRAFT_474965 [Crucibulum laeve]|uniref:NYN domain-containing protein n=1 Tax=Crucibulum laeve TaxID=68775 RepID=A0A5C3LI76_9AGAR|nr:hypothetical protein BDQ12DRAFT_474965 [Crucibulum laeve]